MPIFLFLPGLGKLGHCIFINVAGDGSLRTVFPEAPPGLPCTARPTVDPGTQAP